MTGERHAAGSPNLLATARSLAVDGITAEVVEAFGQAGIRTILLKGPTLALWLYDDGAARFYMDSDLLVPPSRLGDAEMTLRVLGFERRESNVQRAPREQPHSEPWSRPRDGAEVDLHVTLFGLGVSPEEAWTRVAGTAERIVVGGTRVEVLDPPARALLVALHAAQHGPEKAKPLEDLRRAMERLSDESWLRVAELAEELHASQNLVRGLRLLPEGEALSDRLGLVDGRLAALAAEPGSRAALVIGLDRLVGAPGFRAKVRMVAREAFPPPDFLRWWLPLARRGPLGLGAAYCWRLGWLVWRLPPSIRAWRRSRRTAGVAT